MFTGASTFILRPWRAKTVPGRRYVPIMCQASRTGPNLACYSMLKCVTVPTAASRSFNCHSMNHTACARGRGGAGHCCRAAAVVPRLRAPQAQGVHHTMFSIDPALVKALLAKQQSSARAGLNLHPAACGSCVLLAHRDKRPYCRGGHPLVYGDASVPPGQKLCVGWAPKPPPAGDRKAWEARGWWG